VQDRRLLPERSSDLQRHHIRSEIVVDACLVDDRCLRQQCKALGTEGDLDTTLNQAGTRLIPYESTKKTSGWLSSASNSHLAGTARS
jgi:hypothetical protein